MLSFDDFDVFTVSMLFTQVLRPRCSFNAPFNSVGRTTPRKNTFEMRCLSLACRHSSSMMFTLEIYNFVLITSGHHLSSFVENPWANHLCKVTEVGCLYGDFYWQPLTRHVFDILPSLKKDPDRHIFVFHRQVSCLTSHLPNPKDSGCLFILSREVNRDIPSSGIPGIPQVLWSSTICMDFAKRETFFNPAKCFDSDLDNLRLYLIPKM